jgi:hypothetical protein
MLNDFIMVLIGRGLNERFRSSAELVSDAVVVNIVLGLINDCKKTFRFNRRFTVFYLRRVAT